MGARGEEETKSLLVCCYMADGESIDMGGIDNILKLNTIDYVYGKYNVMGVMSFGKKGSLVALSLDTSKQ